jgi:hypothetical protein
MNGKKLRRRMFAAAALCGIALVSSCSSISQAFAFQSKESWSSREGAVRGTVSLENINVDTVSNWNSLEREIAGILPLLFLEKGYRFLEKGGTDFTAEVSLIEREYMEGWQTKRSISVELRIWGAEKTALPLAAGRAMLSGSKSLASSQTANKLLRVALSQALLSLEQEGA